MAIFKHFPFCILNGVNVPSEGYASIELAYFNTEDFENLNLIIAASMFQSSASSSVRQNQFLIQAS